MSDFKAKCIHIRLRLGLRLRPRFPDLLTGFRGSFFEREGGEKKRRRREDRRGEGKGEEGKGRRRKEFQ